MRSRVRPYSVPESLSQFQSQVLLQTTVRLYQGTVRFYQGPESRFSEDRIQGLLSLTIQLFQSSIRLYTGPKSILLSTNGKLC